MSKCQKIKESESTDQELGQMLANLDNEYDWTLVYREVTKEGIEKKKVINQFHVHPPSLRNMVQLAQSR
jgi:hypothetical protein